MDPERGLLQDGRTVQEFLEELFEYGYCAECDGDMKTTPLCSTCLGCSTPIV